MILCIYRGMLKKLKSSILRDITVERYMKKLGSESESIFRYFSVVMSLDLQLLSDSVFEENPTPTVTHHFVMLHVMYFFRQAYMGRAFNWFPWWWSVFINLFFGSSGFENKPL